MTTFLFSPTLRIWPFLVHSSCHIILCLLNTETCILKLNSLKSKITCRLAYVIGTCCFGSESGLNERTCVVKRVPIVTALPFFVFVLFLNYLGQVYIIHCCNNFFKRLVWIEGDLVATSTKTHNHIASVVCVCMGVCVISRITKPHRKVAYS